MRMKIVCKNFVRTKAIYRMLLPNILCVTTKQVYKFYSLMAEFCSQRSLYAPTILTKIVFFTLTESLFLYLLLDYLTHPLIFPSSPFPSTAHLFFLPSPPLYSPQLPLYPPLCSPSASPFPLLCTPPQLPLLYAPLLLPPFPFPSMYYIF